MKSPRKFLTREVRITLVIWAILLSAAIAGLLLLNANATWILNHIYIVSASRGAKAEALYAEADQEAAAVFKEAQRLNNEASKKVLVNPSNRHFERATRLFHDAFAMDIRPEFDASRAEQYELYAQVMDAAGEEEEQLLASAKAFLARGDKKDALQYIDKARALPRASIEPAVLQAQAELLDKDTSAAAAALGDLMTSSALSAKGYYVRSQVQAGLGKQSAATADLEQAVKAQPSSVTYRRAYAVALAAEGRVKDSLAVFQQGLDKGGWNDAAYLHVYGDNLLKASQFNEAIRVLQRADELAPQSGDVQLSLARAYYKNGQARMADSVFRRAIQARPELHDKLLDSAE